MKKKIIIVVAFGLILSISACSSTTTSDTTAKNTEVSNSATSVSDTSSNKKTLPDNISSNDVDSEKVPKSKPYHDIMYGMSSDEIKEKEEAASSYRENSYSAKYDVYYVPLDSSKYAEFIYEINDDKTVGIMVTSMVPWMGGTNLPDHIKRNLISPDNLYTTLCDELTELYGNPKITDRTVVWENEYEVIEGGIKDYEQDLFGGNIVDENGKVISSDSVTMHRCDFFFQLKDKDGNPSGRNNWRS